MADVLTLTPGGHLFAGTWEDLQGYARAKCAACGMLVKDSGELLHLRPEGEGNTREAELCTGWRPAARFDALDMIVRGIVREAPNDQPNGPLECAIEEAHEAHLRMLDVVLPLTQAHPEAHGALRACGDAIADLTSLLADQARALELASGPAVPPGAIATPHVGTAALVTDEELAEVARLDAEATPGPWQTTARFIAYTRTLLPRLVAEVQHLRDERADASAVLTAIGHPDDSKPLAQRIADARAETMAHLDTARAERDTAQQQAATMRGQLDRQQADNEVLLGEQRTLRHERDDALAHAAMMEQERDDAMHDMELAEEEAGNAEARADDALDLLSRLVATWAGGGNPDDMRRLATEAEALLGVQPEEQPTC